MIFDWCALLFLRPAYVSRWIWRQRSPLCQAPRNLSFRKLAVFRGSVCEPRSRCVMIIIFYLPRSLSYCPIELCPRIKSACILISITWQGNFITSTEYGLTNADYMTFVSTVREVYNIFWMLCITCEYVHSYFNTSPITLNTNYADWA